MRLNFPSQASYHISSWFCFCVRPERDTFLGFPMSLAYVRKETVCIMCAKSQKRCCEINQWSGSFAFWIFLFIWIPFILSDINDSSLSANDTLHVEVEDIFKWQISGLVLFTAQQQHWTLFSNDHTVHPVIFDKVKYTFNFFYFDFRWLCMFTVFYINLYIYTCIKFRFSMLARPIQVREIKKNSFILMSSWTISCFLPQGKWALRLFKPVHRFLAIALIPRESVWQSGVSEREICPKHSLR